MKLHLDTRTLHREGHDPEQVELYVNDRLEAVISIGKCQTRDTLLAQVQGAWALRALVSQVQRLPALVISLATLSEPGSTDQKQAACLRGLAAGLLKPHPTTPHLPEILPEASRSYERGWQVGDGWRRACLVSQAGEEASYVNECVQDP